MQKNSRDLFRKKEVIEIQVQNHMLNILFAIIFTASQIRSMQKVNIIARKNVNINYIMFEGA